MFPRLNTSLSEYLKTSRARTSASVALTIAAAAGVGAASTAAGTQPWTASLNGMARAGHSTAQDSTDNAAGKNVFGTVVGSHSEGRVAGTHAAPAAPSTPAGQAVVKVADAQKAAPKAKAPKAAPAAPGKPQTGVGGLLPLPKHPAPVQKPAPPVRHALVPKKAPAPKATPPKKAPTPKPAPPKKHHPAEPSKPYTIYDSTRPGSIPSGQPQVAVYGNGNFQASFASVNGRHKVLWIDAKGGNPGCDVLDVEPGDATPSTAANWVKARESQQPGHVAIIYTMLSEWSAVKSAINTLPSGVKDHVRYWIADPTGTPHIVSGSSATQWYWGSSYDLTKALPGFES